MEALFLRVLNMSITSAYVILAILLIRLVLRRAPKKYSYALWSVAAFRLVCPVSFKSVFSLFSVKLFDMTAAQSSGGTALTYVPYDIGYMARPEVTVGIPAVNSAISGSLPAATPYYSVNPVQVYTAIAAFIWCVGMAVLVIYAAVSLILLHRRMANAVRADGNVYCSDRVLSPFILGLVHPRIYVPFGLDEETFRYVLEHERYHIKRYDHIIKPIAFLVLAVHWFNPLCWLAFSLMSRDMEMSCDEKVLSLDGKSRKVYSTALLGFAANRRFPAPSPLAFSETGVKTRIKNALRFKKPAVWVTAAALVIVVAVIIFCAANPAETPDDIFGLSYRIEKTVFSHGTHDDSAAGYAFNLSGGLIEYDSETGEIQSIGPMTETELTKDNFDAYLRTPKGTDGWSDDSLSAAKLRRNNHRAWRLVIKEKLTYLLCQKNGEVYLCSGWYDAEGETDPYSDDSAIRRIYKLERYSAVLPTALIEDDGSAYVSSRLLYMTPISSFAAIGGDSGCRYYFTEDSFVMEHRAEGGGAVSIPVDSWEWQPYPFTDGAWDALFEIDLWKIPNPAEQHSSVLYLPIGDEYFLLSVDGEIWLFDLMGNGTLWSAYALIPESEMGVVHWQLSPAVSAVSPWMTVRFDVEFNEAQVFCDGGKLSANGEESFVTLKPGDELHWYPRGDDTLYASSSRISFTLQPGGKTIAGTLYITGKTNDFGMGYTVNLVSDSLRLKQDPDTGHAVIYVP